MTRRVMPQPQLVGTLYVSRSSLISKCHSRNIITLAKLTAPLDFLHYIATKVKVLEADSRADGVLKKQSFIDQQNLELINQVAKVKKSPFRRFRLDVELDTRNSY